ncbi:hypothetical protein ACWDV4_23160 [Micromonospora sp. NPDC003197]
MLELASTAVTTVADRILAVGDVQTAPLTGSVVDQLYATVAVRLGGSPIGGRFLRALETYPADPAARWDAVQAVTAEAESDAWFASELGRLVAELPTTAVGHPGQPVSHPTQPIGDPGQAASYPVPPPDRPVRRSRLNLGGIVVGVALAAVLLVLGTAFYVNLVAPRLGLTEGDRLDRVAGEWRGQVGGGQLVLTIGPDGVATVANRIWSCAGEVTSPARSEYTIRVDCGLLETALVAELSPDGDRLTLDWPGQSVQVVLDRT